MSEERTKKDQGNQECAYRKPELGKTLGFAASRQGSVAGDRVTHATTVDNVDRGPRSTASIGSVNRPPDGVGSPISLGSRTPRLRDGGGLPADPFLAPSRSASADSAKIVRSFGNNEPAAARYLP